MPTKNALFFGLVPTGPTRSLMGRDLLLRAAAIMAAVLLAAVAFYNIPGMVGNRVAQEVAGWFLVAGTMTAYFLGYKALRSSPENSTLRKTVIGSAMAFCLLALLIPPFFSTDVYCYGNIGWQQVKYDLNPYVCSVNQTPNWKDDPMFCAEWEDAPSAYGFLFSELAYAVCWLGGGNQGLTALLFKLINLAIFGTTGWLIWRGCKQLGQANPEQALYLFLWNPLLLLHVLSDGHNDLLMGLCTAACILYMIENGWFLAIPLLMAGALVKYGSAAILPFLLFYMAKRFGKTKAAIGLILGLVLCMATAAPYLIQDWRDLALGRMADNASWWCCWTLSAFLYYPYDMVSQLFPTLATSKFQVMAAIKLILWTGFLAFYLRLLVVRMRGAYDMAHLLFDSVLIQFALICFVSCKFYPWYMGMFLPLVFWLPAGGKLRHAVLAITCAQMLAFTFLRNAHGINAAILLLGPLAYALFPPPENTPWAAHALAQLSYLRNRAFSAVVRVYDYRR